MSYTEGRPRCMRQQGGATSSKRSAVSQTSSGRHTRRCPTCTQRQRENSINDKNENKNKKKKEKDPNNPKRYKLKIINGGKKGGKKSRRNKKSRKKRKYNDPKNL